MVLDESTGGGLRLHLGPVQRNGADVYSFSADTKTKKIEQLADSPPALCD